MLVISACVSGSMEAPSAPCATRDARSTGKVGASPHAMEATVKNIVAETNIRT
jgi:hypothetical protein